MQQFATKIASKTPEGTAARKQIGLNAPGLDTQTIAGPDMKMPAPLGEAKIGLTNDDPRRRAMRAAGQSETILGTKLG